MRVVVIAYFAVMIEFFDELGIARHIEPTHQMRLQAIGAPVALAAGRADAQFGGHSASA